MGETIYPSKDLNHSNLELDNYLRNKKSLSGCSNGLGTEQQQPDHMVIDAELEQRGLFYD